MVTSVPSTMAPTSHAILINNFSNCFRPSSAPVFISNFVGNFGIGRSPGKRGGIKASGENIPAISLTISIGTSAFSNKQRNAASINRLMPILLRYFMTTVFFSSRSFNQALYFLIGESIISCSFLTHLLYSLNATWIS